MELQVLKELLPQITTWNKLYKCFYQMYINMLFNVLLMTADCLEWVDGLSLMMKFAKYLKLPKKQELSWAKTTNIKCWWSLRPSKQWLRSSMMLIEQFRLKPRQLRSSFKRLLLSSMMLLLLSSFYGSNRINFPSKLRKSGQTGQDQSKSPNNRQERRGKWTISQPTNTFD